MLIKLGFILINLFLIQIALSENVTNETSHNVNNEIGYNITEESADNDTEIRYEDLGRQLRPAPRVCSCLRWTAWGSYGSPRTMDWSFLKTLRYSKDTLKSKATEYGQNPYKDICETHLSVGCRVLSRERNEYDYSTQYSACPIYTYRSAPVGGLVQLRFLCPDYLCPCLAWSDWYDYDNPDGEGDIETLLGTIPKKQWPCVNGERPLDVDCRTLSGKRISQTNNKAVTCDLNGLKCYNRDQGPRCTCEDYKVRFLCFRGHVEHGEIAGYSERRPPPPRKPYRPHPQPPRHYPEEEEIIAQDIVVPVDEQSYKHDDEYPEPPQELYPAYKEKPKVPRPPRPGHGEYEGDSDYLDLEDDDKGYEPRPLYPPHEAPRTHRNPDYGSEDYEYPNAPDPQVSSEDDYEGCNSRQYSCRRQRPRRPVEVPVRTIERGREREYRPPGEEYPDAGPGHIGGKGKGHGRKEGHSRHPGTKPRQPEYPPHIESEEHEYEHPDKESTDAKHVGGGHYGDKDKGHGKSEGGSHHGTRPRKPSYHSSKEHKPPHHKSTLIGADTDIISGKPKPRGPTGEVVDADVKVIDEDSLGGILGGKRKGKEEHGRHNGNHKDYPDRDEHGGKDNGHGSHGEAQHSKIYGNPQPEGHEENPGSEYNPDTVPHAGSNRKDQLLKKDEKTLVGANVDAITGKDGPERPDGEVVDADIAALGEGDGPLDSVLKKESDTDGASEHYENPDGEYVPPSETSDGILDTLPVESENPPAGAYDLDELDVSQPEVSPDNLPPTDIDDKLPSKDPLPVKPGTLIGADADVIGGEDKSERPTGEVVDADVTALEKGGPLAGVLHTGKDGEGDQKPPSSNGQYGPGGNPEDVKRIPPASLPDVYGTNPEESGILGGSGADSYKEPPIQGESIPDVPVVGKDKAVAADVLALTTKDETADYGSITDVGVSSLADPGGKRKKAPAVGLLGRSGASEPDEVEDSMDEPFSRMVMPQNPSKDDCWMRKLIYSIFAAKSPVRGTEHLHKLQFRDDCPDYYDDDDM